MLLKSGFLLSHKTNFLSAVTFLMVDDYVVKTH